MQPLRQLHSSVTDFKLSTKYVAFPTCIQVQFYCDYILYLHGDIVQHSRTQYSAGNYTHTILSLSFYEQVSCIVDWSDVHVGAIPHMSLGSSRTLACLVDIPRNHAGHEVVTKGHGQLMANLDMMAGGQNMHHQEGTVTTCRALLVIALQCNAEAAGSIPTSYSLGRDFLQDIRFHSCWGGFNISNTLLPAK